MELNKIYNEDCYEGIKKIPDKSIDLIVTDPPYEMSRGGMTGIFKYRNNSGHKYYDEIMDKKLDKGIDLKILDEYVRVMKKINIYIWCNKDQIYDYMTFFTKKHNCNFEIIIWAKIDPTPFTCGHYLKDKEYCLFFWEKGVKLKGNFETMKTVYVSQKNKKDGKEYGHPTIKPLDIIENLIKNSSDVGGVILDSFIGSGTTAVACKKLGRNFIGFEINKHFYDIALDRLKGISIQDRKEMNAGQLSLFDYIVEE